MPCTLRYKPAFITNESRSRLPRQETERPASEQEALAPNNHARPHQELSPVPASCELRFSQKLSVAVDVTARDYSRIILFVHAIPARRVISDIDRQREYAAHAVDHYRKLQQCGERATGRSRQFVAGMLAARKNSPSRQKRRKGLASVDAFPSTCMHVYALVAGLTVYTSFDPRAWVRRDGCPFTFAFIH